ncbi:MAG: hypothetical protein R3272_14015 [Candidatus Promineifilaceae bacterium]|nr:hypothetical protein [Candidatus Promineifilaceae bacterium]
MIHTVRLSLVLLCAVVALSGVSCRGENLEELGEGTILVQEDFTADDLEAWLIEGDAAGQTALVGEQLVIAVHEPNTVQYATLVGETFEEFFLQVDVTQLAGSPASSYGILFGLGTPPAAAIPGATPASPSGFYRFEVTGEGQYMVERREQDGRWVRLTEEWVESPALTTELGATNELAIRAAGSELSFYANGQELTRLTDASYSGGHVALDAGTWGTPGLEVAFDNLVIREP